MKKLKKKKIDEALEAETSLEEQPISEDKMLVIENKLEEMATQYNAFVQTMAKMQQRTDDILQMIIRPPEQPTQEGNGEKKKTDIKSHGISETMGKKVSDATLHELIEAGDLALRVHDRRQGLTDLEEFMVGLGKNTLQTFGQASSSAVGRKTV